MLEEISGLDTRCPHPGQSKPVCSDVSLGLGWVLGSRAGWWKVLQVLAVPPGRGLPGGTVQSKQNRERGRLVWRQWVSVLGYFCTGRTRSGGEKVLQGQRQRTVLNLIVSYRLGNFCFPMTVSSSPETCLQQAACCGSHRSGSITFGLLVQPERVCVDSARLARRSLTFLSCLCLLPTHGWRSLIPQSGMLCGKT